jgi:hypothetical protein
MTIAIRYCGTGCKRHGRPTQIDPPATICRRCENQLRDWLTAIPDLYALLPTFIHHGTTDRNPDSKATKAANAPAPMRLDIIDLLDTRHARKWLGTDHTDNQRGTLGTVAGWANTIRDERHLKTPAPTTVAQACDLLATQMLWLIEQPWAHEAHAELKTLHRELSDAIGDYRPRPVGRCHVDNEDGEPCGGPLLANNYGGVHCPRCNSTWDANHLRQLGLAQAQESA